MESASAETQKDFLDGQSLELFAETITSFFTSKEYTQEDFEINVEEDCITTFKNLFSILFDNK